MSSDETTARVSEKYFAKHTPLESEKPLKVGQTPATPGDKDNEEQQACVNSWDNSRDRLRWNSNHGSNKKLASETARNQGD
jgi:hypothetical protein